MNVEIFCKYLKKVNKYKSIFLKNEKYFKYLSSQKTLVLIFFDPKYNKKKSIYKTFFCSKFLIPVNKKIFIFKNIELNQINKNNDFEFYDIHEININLNEKIFELKFLNNFNFKIRYNDNSFVEIVNKQNVNYYIIEKSFLNSKNCSLYGYSKMIYGKFNNGKRQKK